MRAPKEIPQPISTETVTKEQAGKIRYCGNELDAVRFEKQTFANGEIAFSAYTESGECIGVN